MVFPDWAEGVDISAPSAARIYDYWLGGLHNFAVDRAAAEKLLATRPGLRYMAQANRAFLRRAVRFLADAGIRQFLDLGSGIPTVDSVHDLVQRDAPTSRVVYVDMDPVAIIHSKNLLAGNDRATAILGDIRRPERILAHPDLRRMIDLDQPVAVLLVSVLHFVPGEPAYRVVAALRDAVGPGSYLAMSHACPDAFSEEEMAKLNAVYDNTATSGGHARTREEVNRLFDGFDLVPPGLVWLPQWRPEPGDGVPADPGRAGLLAAVGRRAGGHA